MVRTFEVQDLELDEENPWDGILAAVMFAMRATFHTTLKATPMQLVFGRDALLNISFEANWKLIKENKQRLIRRNNERENKKRTPYTYKVGQKVLVENKMNQKFGRNPYNGPFIVKKVKTNGTLVVKMGSVLEIVNLRIVKPYSSM